MTKISTKSFTRNIAKLDVYDKVGIGLCGGCIFTGSLLAYQIIEIDRRTTQIAMDQIKDRERKNAGLNSSTENVDWPLP